MASLKMQIRDHTTHLVKVNTNKCCAIIVNVITPTWAETFIELNGYEDKNVLWKQIVAYCTASAHANGFTPIIRLFVDKDECKRIVGDKPLHDNITDSYSL
jgi:hypothetical protein